MDPSESQGGHSDGAHESAGSPPNSTHAQFAQALRELSRGEQAAAALEKNLSNLESKLDEILASFEDNMPAADEKEPAQPPTGHGKEPANGSGNDGNR
ncbi:hypothetical protein QBC33DRAFT_374439 [Phialemonium atrogriseum]|uniref:Uncharacterized protein n=1 Tax=Phialemonium atrogriseum TaxID=1093897 RepID=A0AAJ0C1H0_9PEZI|nr:uncharacterized protein QBC33DRAFT_374439 [Phialemonium atrogriseum]KAK1768384.1 hypothetical protein QBC33DRAFT_374439 [Phialemonium atrogriseum]